MNQTAKTLISRRNALITAGALSLSPLFYGCTNKPPLIIAGHKWPGYELVFLAREMNMLSGSNAHLLETPNASISMQAIRDGKAQAAMLTLDEMIRLCSEGFDLKVVLVFDISVGADAVIGQAYINEAKQLIGKKIGYEDSALGALMLHEFLNLNLLEANEVELVKVTYDQHVSAWQSKQIDALITFEPIATQLLKQGATKLFDSRQIPDKIFDVLVVTEQAAKQHSNDINDIIKAHFQALQHFRTNPMDASHRIAKRLNMSAEDIMLIYRGLLIPDALSNHGYLSKQDPRLINATENLIQIMRNAGIIVADCDLTNIFTNSSIPKDLI